VVRGPSLTGRLGHSVPAGVSPPVPFAPPVGIGRGRLPADAPRTGGSGTAGREKGTDLRVVRGGPWSVDHL
jgi:hypothetical protein